MKEPRSGLLAAVSDWLKLVALIVLVGESVILTAMKLTPDTSPVHAWYPVFMLLFLIPVVVGVFVDRYFQTHRSRDDLRITVGDVAYSVETRDLIPANQASATATSDKLFIDSEREFQFELPEGRGWSKPERLSLGGYLVHSGMLPDENAFEEMKKHIYLVPMGKMIAEASALCVWYGDPVEARLTDETTTTAIETVISRMVALAKREGDEPDEDDIKKLRRTFVTQELPIETLRIQNGLTILTRRKDLARESPVKPTLPNLFRQIMQGGPPLDKIVASEQAIVWGSTMTFKNLLINGENREVTVNQLNHLTEGDDFFYHVVISYSPQTEDSLNLWDELQAMSDSFNRRGRTTSGRRRELVS